MSPTRRTVVALFVAALSAVWASPEVAGFAVAAVVATFAAEAWSIRRPPTVVVELPSEVIRGVADPFTVSATSAGPGQRVWVRQPQTADVRLEPAEALGTLEGTLVTLRRGDHELAPVVSRTVGLLGLASWTRSHESSPTSPHVVHSHADLPGGRRIAMAVQQGRFSDPGLRRGELGLGTNFESVRDYAPDDDIRRINWMATERTGQPMVNQYRQDTERELWCLIDTGRLLAGPVGDRTRLDVALDAVAAVAAVADVVGDRIGAVVFDDRVRRVVPPRRAAAADLVRSLDPLEATATDADYDAAFAQVASAKRSLVVVFTDLLDVAAARGLVAAVPVLARRHAVVLASVSDPDLVAAVTTPPSRVRDLHVATVARDLLAERRAVEASLGAMGAMIVEGPVERFPSACVGAYLRLKSVARI